MRIKLSKPRDHYDERTLQYIDLLSIHPLFDKLVKKARMDCKITNLSTCISSAGMMDAVYKNAQVIIELYSLPLTWRHGISKFIVTGTFPPLGDGVYLRGQPEIWDSDKDKFVEHKSLEVVIDHRVTFNSLIQWLNDNKQDITQQLQKLPKLQQFKDATRDSLKIRMCIMDLYYNQGMKPSDISGVLMKEYPQYGSSLYTNKGISDVIYKLKKLLPSNPK